MRAIAPAPETAARTLRELLTEAIQEFDPPRDDRGRDQTTAAIVAEHVAWYLTLAGESAEEEGECCPLCAAVREAGERL